MRKRPTQVDTILEFGLRNSVEGGWRTFREPMKTQGELFLKGLELNPWPSQKPAKKRDPRKLLPSRLIICSPFYLSSKKKKKKKQ